MAAAVHATAVAHRIEGRWRAVLLIGPSGAGKSDLALRLMADGWRLIGDDYVHLIRSGQGLYATATQGLRGAVEARGVGLVAAPFIWLAPVALVVDLATAPERLPPPRRWVHAAVEVPSVGLDPFEASAVHKVKLALDTALARHQIILGPDGGLA